MAARNGGHVLLCYQMRNALIGAKWICSLPRTQSLPKDNNVPVRTFILSGALFLFKA